MEKGKMGAGALTFVILQVVYLFFFLFVFPASFENALGLHLGVMDAVASWLSTSTLVVYAALTLMSVIGVILRRAYFLRLFQIAGLVALIGNLAVFILRQFVDNRYASVGQYGLWGGNYYWVLFIFALFWVLAWNLFFMRSSQVYSYMGEDDTYLRKAFFTKNVKTPAPYVAPPPYYSNYPAQRAAQYPYQYPAGYAYTGQQAPAQYPAQQPYAQQPGYYAQQPAQPGYAAQQPVPQAAPVPTAAPVQQAPPQNPPAPQPVPAQPQPAAQPEVYPHTAPPDAPAQ